MLFISADNEADAALWVSAMRPRNYDAILRNSAQFADVAPALYR